MIDVKMLEMAADKSRYFVDRDVLEALLDRLEAAEADKRDNSALSHWAGWKVRALKAEAERDALAAHVEEAKRIFEDAPEVDPHPHGWVLAVDIAAAQDWIDGMLAQPLARLKAEWQAEALATLHLEDCATLQDVLERQHAAINELRRQAEGHDND